jgi:hypothetical protein
MVPQGPQKAPQAPQHKKMTEAKTHMYSVTGQYQSTALGLRKLLATHNPTGEFVHQWTAGYTFNVAESDIEFVFYAAKLSVVTPNGHEYRVSFNDSGSDITFRDVLVDLDRACAEHDWPFSFGTAVLLK